jgi:membrane protein DedA with SNARE-associated domain
MEGTALAMAEYLAAHAGAAPFVALALAIAETVAFLSIFIPATALLMAAGALTATGAFPFLPLWAGAATGAVIGSTFSWWLGRHFGARILAARILRDQADAVARAQALFERWGAAAIVAGHFVGPLRPVAFLFAGMSGIGFWRFQRWNLLGAVGWAFLIPQTGALGGDLAGWLRQFLGL